MCVQTRDQQNLLCNNGFVLDKELKHCFIYFVQEEEAKGPQEEEEDEWSAVALITPFQQQRLRQRAL